MNLRKKSKFIAIVGMYIELCKMKKNIKNNQSLKIQKKKFKKFIKTNILQKAKKEKK